MPRPERPARSTSADVAERAGVSISTISRVINRTAPVAEETAARVRAAIAELNYVPHAAARNLASKRTNTLGLVVPAIASPFMVPLLRGMVSAAREARFNLLIYSIEDEPCPGFQRPLGEHNTDGLLVFAGGMDKAELCYLNGIGFPMVLLYQSPPDDLAIPYVIFENRAGACKMVEHLIETHGYRRIAFLKGPESQEDTYWREVGYREALDAHGISCDPALIATGGFFEATGQMATEKWLSEGIDIEAIFCDDESALGVIKALYEAGKRVPEDVAVVGFDDVHLANYLLPPLTTVRSPIEQSGREAVRQLMQLIHTGQADPVVLLPTELVIRRSCGCG